LLVCSSVVTILITAVTSGSIATAERSAGIAVDTVWVVALHLGSLVHESVCAEEVLPSTRVAVPVLCTVEQVRVVAWLSTLAYICRMMVVWPTVGITCVPTSIWVAVLVTFVTDQPIATVDTIIPVTHHSLSIVLKIFLSMALVL